EGVRGVAAERWVASSVMDAASRRAVDALSRIGLLLEGTREPTDRVRALRNAASTVAELPDGELQRRLDDGTLTELSGIGEKTSAVIAEAVSGGVPSY